MNDRSETDGNGCRENGLDVNSAATAAVESGEQMAEGDRDERPTDEGSSSPGFEVSGAGQNGLDELEGRMDAAQSLEADQDDADVSRFASLEQELAGLSRKHFSLTPRRRGRGRGGGRPRGATTRPEIIPIGYLQVSL